MVPSDPKTQGHCDPRFAPVGRAFEQNFVENGELGAAVAITVGGEAVVDLWAGSIDPGRNRAWQRDTIVDVFSVGKAIAALCVLVLVDRGRVDLEEPVARHWPEFAACGKQDITIEMLLSHRAGLPGIRRLLSDDAIYDQQAIAAALADDKPWWPPGRQHGYHVNTFGFLVAELVRRIDGRDFGRFFREEVAQPLDADFQFGTAPEDDARTAHYSFEGESSETAGRAQMEELLGDEAGRRAMLERIYMNPPGISGFGTVNTRAWRGAQIPSANGHATARAVAHIYGALIAGRIVAPETLDRATAEASSGTDFVLGRPSRFGLGFQLTQPERPLGPNPRSFGHFGAGGSLGFADPDAGLAFGYVMNSAGPRWQNPRNRALVDAVYEALG